MSEKLVSLFKSINDSQTKEHKTTPQHILNLYGAKRRGSRVVQDVNRLLEENGLTAEPDFNSCYCYGDIYLKARPKVGVSESTDLENLVPKLGMLAAANMNVDPDNPKLISLQLNNSLKEAVTLMIQNDVSQIPIIKNNKRTAEGIVTWKTIGAKLALNPSIGLEDLSIKDCMESVDVLNIETPLFDAVDKILKGRTVLVYNKRTGITGIVTARNIGEQFIYMATPFLLLEQIENHVRKLLAYKLEEADITKVLKEDKMYKDLNNDLTNLTFGQYVIILENKDNYSKLGLNLDRKLFLKMLERTRDIRNDVMHFNPEKMDDEDLSHLEKTLKTLKKVS